MATHEGGIVGPVCVGVCPKAGNPPAFHRQAATSSSVTMVAQPIFFMRRLLSKTVPRAHVRGTRWETGTLVNMQSTWCIKASSPYLRMQGDAKDGQRREGPQVIDAIRDDEQVDQPQGK